MRSEFESDAVSVQIRQESVAAGECYGPHAELERSSSRVSTFRSKGNPRIAPSRRPNVLSTPRM
jgi:hypothetical protein